MASLRPHRNFDFVKLWKTGFIISAVLIALSLIGLLTSLIVTGSALTLGNEFSGGTSIQIQNAQNITEQQVRDAFNKAKEETGIDTQISSIQTSSSSSTGDGFIIKTMGTVSTDANTVASSVIKTLGLNPDDVKVSTISASWGANVIWTSFLAFILSCIAILIVIALRYKEPRMGVVALITLFHDLIIIIGVYAWTGMFFHMEITSNVIAALLAIIGYSLYDTIVIFHRINKNASPQMKCSLRTCANKSVNEVIVRSMNTSITSILPVLLILLFATDTLLDFAFAMFIGMILGFYSTLAISSPIYTLWKEKDPAYAKLERKYPYVVEQSPYTKEMLKADIPEFKKQQKIDKAEEKKQRKKMREEGRKQYEKQREEIKKLKAEYKKAQAEEKKKRAEKKAAEKIAQDKKKGRAKLNKIKKESKKAKEETKRESKDMKTSDVLDKKNDVEHIKTSNDKDK